jgi:hypothetical protein
VCRLDGDSTRGDPDPVKPFVERSLGGVDLDRSIIREDNQR